MTAAVVLSGVVKAYRSYEHELDRLVEVLTGRPRHREFRALDGITLEIPHGQVVGVIGRNGAGKSTLLKLIAGTARPTAGSIQVNGRVAALLELGSGFHPEMTGRENAYLSGAIMGLDQATMDELYPTIAGFSGIESFMDQPVKTYSSGMFMRLAFAVATCVEPDILILDEALSVGDGAFARKSFERIRSIRDHGKTILFCSHSLYQVEAICNRVVWIDEGRVRMDGVPGDVTAAYGAFLDAESQPRPEDRPVHAPATGGVCPSTDTGRFTGVRVSVNGSAGPELELTSGEADLCVEMHFVSNPSLPSPSVSVGIISSDRRVITSAGTHMDGREIPRNPDGTGEARVVFPKLALLKGTYTVSAFLLSEDALILYDRVETVANFKVNQRGLVQGVVSLPRHWSVGPVCRNGNHEH